MNGAFSVSARNPSSVCMAGTARCNRSMVTVSSLRIFRHCSLTSLGVGWKSPRETPLSRRSALPPPEGQRSAENETARMLPTIHDIFFLSFANCPRTQGQVCRRASGVGVILREDTGSRGEAKLWCLGPESNRYGGGPPRDFKSLASTNSATQAQCQVTFIILGLRFFSSDFSFGHEVSIAEFGLRIADFCVDPRSSVSNKFGGLSSESGGRG